MWNDKKVQGKVRTCYGLGATSMRMDVFVTSDVLALVPKDFKMSVII